MKKFKTISMAAVLMVALLAIFSEPSWLVEGLGWTNGAEEILLISFSMLWNEPVSVSPVNLDWRTVAEPTTMLLFGGALIGLAAWGKKQIRR